MNFPQKEFNENIGGISGFVFIPWNHVRAIPNPVNGIIKTPLSLHPQRTWFSAYASKDSLSFSQEMSSTRAGKFFELTLNGVFPNPSRDVLNLFKNLATYRFFVIFRDRNFVYRFMGYERFPMEFSFSEKTGSRSSDLSGYSFTFSGRQPVPCLIYHVDSGMPNPEF